MIAECLSLQRLGVDLPLTGFVRNVGHVPCPAASPGLAHVVGLGLASFVRSSGLSALAARENSRWAAGQVGQGRWTAAQTAVHIIVIVL